MLPEHPQAPIGTNKPLPGSSDDVKAPRATPRKGQLESVAQGPPYGQQPVAAGPPDHQHEWLLARPP